MSQERLGRNLVYRVSFERVNKLMNYTTANCCEGEACVELVTPACNC